MKQHQKRCLLLFIVLLVFSCCSATVFATVITPEDVQRALAESVAREAAARSSAVQSSLSAVSSKKPVTSKSTYSSRDSSSPSSEVSSESSSMISSDEESSEIILPSVDSVTENNPLSSVIVDTAANQKMNWIGIISWGCIALGVILVLIVVLSNRRPPRGGPGRKRYRRPNRSHKKRLLNDKYYRNMKF